MPVLYITYLPKGVLGTATRNSDDSLAGDAPMTLATA